MQKMSVTTTLPSNVPKACWEVPWRQFEEPSARASSTNHHLWSGKDDTQRYWEMDSGYTNGAVGLLTSLSTGKTVQRVKSVSSKSTKHLVGKWQCPMQCWASWGTEWTVVGMPGLEERQEASWLSFSAPAVLLSLPRSKSYWIIIKTLWGLQAIVRGQGKERQGTEAAVKPLRSF